MKDIFLEIYNAVKAGKRQIELEDGNGRHLGTMQISPDLFRAFERYENNVQEHIKVTKGREEAVAEEVATVGDETLPVGREVTVKGGLTGKIVQVTKGYKDRPYYRIFLQSAEGVYGKPEDECNYGYFYARNLRDYGRGI